MAIVDDQLAFLRAQLDEDERVARQAGAIHAGQNWTGGVDDTDRPYLIGEQRDGYRPGVAEPETVAIATHIARWDPKRVLAEVKAKRRILDELVSWLDVKDEYDTHMTTLEAVALTHIPILAQPYADREGWREEWRMNTDGDGS